MDPKSESSPAPAAEAGKPASAAEGDKLGSTEPVRLARLAMVRLTPDQLAARQKADEEERLAKLEAKKQPTPPRGVSPVPSAPRAPSAPAAPVAAEPSDPPLIAATLDTSVPSPALAVTAPAAPPPMAARATAPPAPPRTVVLSASPPAVAPSAPPPAAAASMVTRIQFRLFDATLGFLGGEGKQIPSLCKLATRVAQRLGVAGAELERLPCAVQALYVASQLDRRGSFEPPDALAVQKLLGSSYEELAALLAPCLKGALGKVPVERTDAAALAATIYFFNQSRTTSPTPQATKGALAMLKSQKWIPVAALDALAAALAG